MGLSSSQGRLLSITARLTSNEYESQQISNAKMRLATQSQAASDDYINALNSQQVLYTTYDEKGNSTAERLTANAMYQYADMKNQYLLTNTSGQVLLQQEDAHKFQEASNLDEFLESYGLKKQWKSTTLESNYNKLESAEFENYRKAWDEKVQAAIDKKDYSVSYHKDGVLVTESNLSSDKAWEKEQGEAFSNYNEVLATYNNEVAKASAGINNQVELSNAIKALSKAKTKYSSCLTYDDWVKTKAAYLDSSNNVTNRLNSEYLNMQDKYNPVLAEYNAEAEDYGSTITDLYTYDDATKAQWYTNLWYRLNGESSEKSEKSKSNYTVLNTKLADSTTWIQDAITQGAITIEVASKAEDSKNTIPDLNNPTVYNLKGISWKATLFSSCSDLTQKDDDQAIARAEAEYERKTQEINAKDEKYQAKIKNLDTEHTALQTEYDSIKSALSKNIDRSFKTFS